MIRVAIVGCGAIAERGHAPALAALADRLKVTAVVDFSAERAGALAASLPGSPEVRKELDGVEKLADIALVATPPHTHQGIASALLERGVYVLCEKPLGRSVAECQAMVDAARRGGAALWAGTNRRYFPSWRLIRDLKAERTLGTLLSLHFEEGTAFNWPVNSFAVFDPAVSGGGVFLDTGAHPADFVVWLTGRAPDLIRYEDDSRGGVEANCLAILRSGEAIFTLRLSRTHDLLNRVVAVFEGGMVSAECWDGVPCTYSCWTPGASGRVGEMLAGLRKSLPANPFEAEWRGIVDELQQGAPHGNAEESLLSIGIIQRCYENRTPLSLPWQAVDAAGKEARQ